jgi:hypothetical protein
MFERNYHPDSLLGLLFNPEDGYMFVLYVNSHSPGYTIVDSRRQDFSELS